MGNPGRAAWAGSSEDVRRRYRRLALVYPLFEVLLALPWGARSKAAGQLGIGEGSRVLEVGVGTGRNLPFLRKAVGTTGRVYGIDVTPEMLEVARRVRTRNHWQNVVLLDADAENYQLPEPVDAILFSLSYSVIPHHQAVLNNVWRQLRPGGRLVVMDGAIPTSALGAVLRPFAVALSHWTVLGNADKRPWEDLGQLARTVHKEELWPGLYYICWTVRDDHGPTPERVVAS